MTGRRSESPPRPPHLLLLGLNHRTAPVAVRECLAFAAHEIEAALAALRTGPAVDEALLVSTCNRVEVLVTTPDPQAAAAHIRRFLTEARGRPVAADADIFYCHLDDEAVRHLFRVAASLDSMVVGEPQILGQIKAAYQAAARCKTAGVILNRLLHRTFFVAKRIRTETGIGDHAVSISYAAVELARKIFGALEGRQVLLIGAGEMAELAVEHLIRQRAGDILVANRTFARGAQLAARFGGRAIGYEEIGPSLAQADIVISSTGASGFVVERDALRPIMRRRRQRPLFFIDIAVPRDIDPRINRLPNVYVYDIDDLKGVVDENIDDRRREALKAERLVDEAVLGFRQWRESLDVVPTLVALRRKLEAIAQVEIEKTLHGPESQALVDAQTLRRMTGAMINKILHDPTLLLKSNTFHGNRAELLGLMRRLFRLDDP
jgi:glutamyl-tRNA reductase